MFLHNLVVAVEVGDRAETFGDRPPAQVDATANPPTRLVFEVQRLAPGESLGHLPVTVLDLVAPHIWPEHKLQRPRPGLGQQAVQVGPTAVPHADEAPAMPHDGELVMQALRRRRQRADQPVPLERRAMPREVNVVFVARALLRFLLGARYFVQRFGD